MMPINYNDYPDDWKQISLRIRERAGWCCEWCKVPNGIYIRRNLVEPQIWSRCDKDFIGDCGWSKARRVVLTVHHIGVAKPDGSPGDPNDKMDCRDENLVALCQRCHLIADQKLRQQHRRITLRCKFEERMKRSGQRSIFGDGE